MVGQGLSRGQGLPGSGDSGDQPVHAGAVRFDDEGACHLSANG
jgi:hypothetical protein